MSGIISNHAHAPHWKRLSEAAILELDPAKLLERIAAAAAPFLTKSKASSQDHQMANS
jgi:hypothetical protein